MITKFSNVYAGHVDLGDMGQQATPANERRYPNERLVSVFARPRPSRGAWTSTATTPSGWPSTTSSTRATSAFPTAADTSGCQHHFQREGYECIPNILMLAVHLAHLTERLRFGCGFNVAPMWHPLRLAEDFATADILTGGRVVFGVGRGYHTREVETFGAPMLDAEANRDLFEEQVDIVMKAFKPGVLLAPGQALHAAARRAVPRLRAQGDHLVPRPLRRPVECWQPIVSASARGLDFMMKHRIKGLIGGGAATMAEKSIYAYQEAAHRAGLDYALGEGLSLGIFYHLADSRERGIREITPWYEEHVKMFGPLGFVPGITPAQLEASTRRGGWGAAGVPTVGGLHEGRRLVRRPPEELIAYLRSLGGERGSRPR